MEIFLNPSIWIKVITLISLEIILSIDNVVVLTILINKLPSKQQNYARFVGLSLALIMRLCLVMLFFWLITFNKYLFKINNFVFSSKNLLFLIGGFFLLFKSIIEIYKNCNHMKIKKSHKIIYSNFWYIIIQIVILDICFSIDSIITAISIINNLTIIIVAIIFGIIITLFSSKILNKFIIKNPKILNICLLFILLTGLSLILDGFGFHVSKDYIYIIIFSLILIEILQRFLNAILTKN
ncbi:MAG: TerC family protein [Pantoea sp. Brub]|nr:TerC family protein [Pantoea sp. Brub]